ncbi:50S ribosomal protein L25/general stress protein Ctc [Virgibacillus phasianinus]|uniref:Large ribosomal subunit protein bL25 n=1 Tax=Virgibacillus phasianinus TaxID=2017483 RepID=A0A220U0X2_9BACI|nr:50S ribosomal protein L25/general stress protein Ctc [Virgibacillus phasianinus]ASK61709.1 50S ribosomal protein L25/general stress protein Ctc [Virgibacillus phasianinus]
MAVKLKATTRKNQEHSELRKIREIGHVPGVVYGKEKESKSIAVDSLDLIKTVRDEGRNAIISLDIENDSSVDVMLHDYQMNPIKDELVHVDFYIVNMSEEMDVEVPLHLEGEAQGVKDGGVLQQPLYELQVRAKPGNIPDEISVNVSNLEVGDSISISDLPTAKDYEFLEDDDTTIVTIVPPDTMDDIEEEPADENAEPELVDAESDDDKEEK